MFTKIKEVISAFKDRPKTKIERKKRRIERQIAKWLPGHHLHGNPVRKEKNDGNERRTDATEE